MSTEITLAYTDISTGWPLILLHGNGENRGYFSAQMSAFAKFFRVIAIDTRGHGDSPRGNAPFTLSQFAEDLLAFMDQLQITKADILGYSDGGNIALLFSLRNPERVRRLVINGANLYPSGMKLAPWLTIDTLYLCARIRSRFSPQAIPQRDLLGLMATQPHIQPKSLSALNMPVLVIVGTHDLIRDGHSRRIVRSLPAGRFVRIHGGHAIAQESPAAFNEAVLAFWTATAEQTAPDSIA